MFNPNSLKSTILGRLGFAANRMSGLLTGGCMIPIAYYFPSSGIDVLAVGALFMSAALCSFSSSPARDVCKAINAFFRTSIVSFLLHYFVQIIHISNVQSNETGLGFGLFFSLWVVIVAKFSDIGALLVGKTIGRTKMAPSISPGKTIGFDWRTFSICWNWCLIPWTVLNYAPTIVDFGSFDFSPSQGALWGFIIAISAVIGDLITSVLKRLAGMKDSGGAIPGIGGFWI